MTIKELQGLWLQEYSDSWSEYFDEVRDELTKTLHPFGVMMEHIGSTAVRETPAQPEIDVMLGAVSILDIEANIIKLIGAGYEYISKCEAEFPRRRHFVRRDPLGFRVNLVAVEKSSRFWREQLAFRNLLRGNEEVRANYVALKRDMVLRHAVDKITYAQAKRAFMQDIIKRFNCDQSLVQEADPAAGNDMQDKDATPNEFGSLASGQGRKNSA